MTEICKNCYLVLGVFLMGFGKCLGRNNRRHAARLQVGLLTPKELARLCLLSLPSHYVSPLYLFQNVLNVVYLFSSFY